MLAIACALQIIVSGCATVRQSGKSKIEHLRAGAGLDFDAVSSDLKRTCGVSIAIGRGYSVTATPLTPGIIQAREEQVGKKSFDSQETIQARITKRLNATQGGTCFELELADAGVGLRYKDTVLTRSNWRFKGGKSSPDQEAEIRAFAPPSPEVLSCSGAVCTTELRNNATICFKPAVTMEHGFTLYALPQFGDTSVKSCNLSWEF